MNKTMVGGAALAAVLIGGPALAGTDQSVSWQKQIGNTTDVQTQSNGGAGITIGIIDTGVLSTHQAVTGSVLTTSSCAAVSFTCSKGASDDNGHGTAVASIAAGVFSASAPKSMSGVAPNAMILSEKVLNASGSGMSNDVANGIMKAVNGGAHVLNVSITYTPTASVINAINYASSKNVVIVYAGGNDGGLFNKGVATSGLTAASLQRLIFVGSVSSTNAISSFSNKPGTASAGSGKSYASMWLVAPGQSIAAPNVKSSATAWSTWSGTSMSAPEVSGAAALLMATWPILTKNGTVAQVLFESARDLGTAGVDSTYGNGLLDLTKAFSPLGALTVTGATGAKIPVSSLTSGMVSSGALGNATAIKSQLANYTAFDKFTRNFRVNLSGLVSTPTAAGSAGATMAPPTTTVSTVKKSLAGGGYFSMTSSRAPTFAETSAFGANGAYDLADRMFGHRDRSVSVFTLVDKKGNMAAMGHGAPATASFAEAMWGADTLAAGQADQLGVSTATFALAQGGYFAAMGYNLSPKARLAFGWTATDQVAGTGLPTDRTRSTAKAVAVALNGRLTDRWTAGLSLSALNENNGLLGTTYDGMGALSMGESHQTRSVAFTTAYDLGRDQAILLDAAYLDTDGTTPNRGVFRSVSPLKARALGVSYMRQNAFAVGDRFTISLKKPLRVVSGSAEMALSDVTADGDPVTTFTRVNLKPNGNATDLSVAYAAPLSRMVSLNGGVDLRRDVRNVRGLNDVAVRFGLGARF